MIKLVTIFSLQPLADQNIEKRSFRTWR